MNANLEDVLALPTSTAECDEGPVVSARPGFLSVKYDVEGDDGLAWTTVAYAGVVAYRFTSDPAVTSAMVEAYSKVAAVLNSPWLKELQSAASSSDISLPDGLRHYVMYFDHTGCLEVVGSSVRLAT